MQDIEQALNQMGISLPPPQTSDSNANGQNGSRTATHGVNGSSDPYQAMHQLMHDIFAAVQYANGAASSGASNQQGGFAGGLQNLISSLGSSSASSSSTGGSSSNSTLNQLQTDFSNFLSTLQTNGSASNGQSQKQSVMTFLQNLEASLGGNSPISGGLLGTTA